MKTKKYLTQFDVESDKFDRLPRVCMALTPGTNEPIRIVRGVEGKFEVSPKTDVARFNKERGITEHQVDAMLAGSMFGWHCPGADPETYSCGSNESTCERRRKSSDNTCEHYPE